MSSGVFSAVSELELWQGLCPGEEKRHEALLALLERVLLDGAIARWAGGLRRQVGLQRPSLPAPSSPAAHCRRQRVGF